MNQSVRWFIYGQNINNELQYNLQVIVIEPVYTINVMTRNITREIIIRQFYINLVTVHETQRVLLITEILIRVVPETLIKLAFLTNIILETDYKTIQKSQLL